VTRCQQRCDLEEDDHISGSEWKSLVSEMYGEMYSIVEGAGLRYFETEASITATGATTYALPSDHLATIYIARVTDSAGHQVRLRRLMVQERVAFVGLTGEAYAYELASTNIVLHPTPASGTYKHLYMPQAPDLSNSGDSTSVDLVNADGEAFLVWGVAVKALAKSESDVQLAMAEREAARVRFTEWCILRAFGEGGRRIVDEAPDDYYDDLGDSFRRVPPL
jgi:hypothetical protein